MDDVDIALLGDVRAAFAQADPMPADLPERIRFALALRDIEIEVARLTAHHTERDEPVLARGAEQSRTITFDSDTLTIMIRVGANADGSVRVDGWLAPAQQRTIEMKTAAGSLTAQTDEQGRFAFCEVPRGTSQLIVQPAGNGSRGVRDAGRSVVTQPLIL